MYVFETDSSLSEDSAHTPLEAPSVMMSWETITKPLLAVCKLSPFPFWPHESLGFELLNKNTASLL